MKQQQSTNWKDRDPQFLLFNLVQVSAVANKRKSGSITMIKYTMDMATPDAIKESSPKRGDSVLSLSLEHLQEKIKKEDSQSSEHLAGYDVTLPNKDGSSTAEVC